MISTILASWFVIIAISVFAKAQKKEETVNKNKVNANSSQQFL